MHCRIFYVYLTIIQNIYIRDFKEIYDSHSRQTAITDFPGLMTPLMADMTKRSSTPISFPTLRSLSDMVFHNS